ncbi:MAG: hypothetical protein RR557_05545 [Bacilli bacterium]
MINVSNEFKTAMKQPIKELDAYIQVADSVIRIKSADDLISIKVSCDTGMCKTAMKKIECSFLGEHNLLNRWIQIGFGVRLQSGNFEYLDYGLFLVTETTTSKDTGITKIIGYDKMICAMSKYTSLNVTYPMDLYSYTLEVCNACGLTLENMTFSNFHWKVTEDLWKNIKDITYRDILVQIAQATGSTCIIKNDNKLYFKYLTATNEQLTYDNMKKLKLEPSYGPLNSVVLSRTPVEDNIYMKDDASITANGLCEFKIENNEIINKDRENAITPIYDVLHGITYHPFETITEGLGWYEIADTFDIVTDTGDVLKTSLFNFSITIDGGIKETLKTNADTKTQTQYQYATTIDKRVKNTEIIVNKQDQYIENLVTDMYTDKGIVNKNYTKIIQNIDNVMTTIEKSGGCNLIKNSAMFDNKNIDGKFVASYWTIQKRSTTSSIEVLSHVEAFKNSISGNLINLHKLEIKQRVYVKRDDPSIAEKTYYTFSCKLSKSLDGNAIVRIYDANFKTVQDAIFYNGESLFYKNIEFKKLLPKTDYFDIIIWAPNSTHVSVCDIMFARGECSTPWQPANGEIMNTQVNINEQGIVVKSETYKGDYTIMSPLEFSGYSVINGALTKVFSLNKETTEIKKLNVKDEINVNPIKILSIEGKNNGIAFVESTKEV